MRVVICLSVLRLCMLGMVIVITLTPSIFIVSIAVRIRFATVVVVSWVDWFFWQCTTHELYQSLHLDDGALVVSLPIPTSCGHDDWTVSFLCFRML